MQENNNSETLDRIYRDKQESYPYGDVRNFAAPGELLITITLGEYRDLIEDITTKERDLQDAADKEVTLKTDLTLQTKTIETLSRENCELKEKAKHYDTAVRELERTQERYLQSEEARRALERQVEILKQAVKDLQDQIQNMIPKNGKATMELQVRPAEETQQAPDPEPEPEKEQKKDPEPEQNPEPEKAAESKNTPPRRPTKQKINLDMGKVRALKKAVWNVASIAEEMGVSQQTIYSRLKEEKDDN